jgi:hypothetical protein
MATKQEKALNRSFLKGKKQGKVREEKHILTMLLAAIIVLLFLLLAQHNGWWPFMRPSLGSAFFTNVSASTTAPSRSSTAGTGSGSTTTSWFAGTSSSTNSSGTSNGSGDSGTSGTGASSSTKPIATFAAGVNVGDTQAQTSTTASGLSQDCAVVVKASSPEVGEQQVCTYTQGNKIVTVTFLNGHVISASKSGF